MRQLPVALIRQRHFEKLDAHDAFAATRKTLRSVDGCARQGKACKMEKGLGLGSPSVHRVPCVHVHGCASSASTDPMSVARGERGLFLVASITAFMPSLHLFPFFLQFIPFSTSHWALSRVLILSMTWEEKGGGAGDEGTCVYTYMSPMHACISSASACFDDNCHVIELSDGSFRPSPTLSVPNLT